MRHYATVLRSFQFAIERYTFSFIALKSSGLALFSIYSLPHRRAALDNITFDVILPSYSLNRITKFKNASEKEANNAAFAYAVQGYSKYCIFGGSSREGISLELRAYSPTDPAYRRGPELSPRQYNYDLREHRYERSTLQPSFSSFPSVPRITSFNSAQEMTRSRRISPATMVSIAAALSELRAVDFYFSDVEKKYPELRERQPYGTSSL